MSTDEINAMKQCFKEERKKGRDWMTQLILDEVQYAHRPISQDPSR